MPQPNDLSSRPTRYRVVHTSGWSTVPMSTMTEATLFKISHSDSANLTVEPVSHEQLVREHEQFLASRPKGPIIHREPPSPAMLEEYDRLDRRGGAGD